MATRSTPVQPHFPWRTIQVPPGKSFVFFVQIYCFNKRVVIKEIMGTNEWSIIKRGKWDFPYLIFQILDLINLMSQYIVTLGMFFSTWSASWACQLCCTQTACYGSSVTWTNMHVRCVAPELVREPRGEKWSSWSFCYIFAIEKIVICKDNWAKGCILHL